MNLGVFDLLYVRRGRLRLAEEERSWTLEAGQALLLRPDRTHRSAGICVDETEFDWVHFQAFGDWEETGPDGASGLVGDHYTYAIRLPKLIEDAPGRPIAQAFSLLQEAASSPSHDAFWLRQQRFLELLRQLESVSRGTAQGASAAAVAEQASAYLKENYRETPGNAELASALGYHAGYIARCMVEVFGCTPQQFLLYYRLDRAKLLLLTTDWPIAKVAEESGFRQLPHFSRLFSAHAGLSPHRFRKRFTP